MPTSPLKLTVPEHPGKEVAVILLAAGPSIRMGTPKQLLVYKDSSLVRHLAGVALASHAASTYVVLGAESSRVRKELSNLPAIIVENPQWAGGLSTSIRAGLTSLPASVRAAILMLCDQPKVSTGLLNSMIDARLSSGKLIVACEYAGTVGVPALFDRSVFSDLSRLTGDRGAKQIITKRVEDVYRIPFPDGSIDLDTQADYKHLPS